MTSQQTVDPPPLLLDRLKARFALTPNHRRPLSGRVVDTRFDPATGQLRGVTDYELIGRWMGGDETFGKRIRQVWSFVVDGVHLKFNDAFDHEPHFGILYLTTCDTCETELWRGADRGAERCRHCRWTHSTTPTCAVWSVRCSTAYVKRGCRCETCAAWKRSSRRIGNWDSSRTNPLGERAPGAPQDLELSQLPPARSSDPSDWLWLPATVRDELQAHADAMHAHADAEPETELLTRIEQGVAR